MKRIRKSKNNTMLVQKLFEAGQEEDKLDTNVYKTILEKHGYMTWNQLENIYRKLQTMSQPRKKKLGLELLESFMLESLQVNNLKILTGSENYFSLLSRVLKLSQTLEVVLISTDRASPPWLEKFVETKSIKLLLPTKTDYVGSHMNYLNSSVKSTDVKSWFTEKHSKTHTLMTMNLNSKTICCQSLTSLLPPTTESDQPRLKKKEKGVKSKQPTEQEKTTQLATNQTLDQSSITLQTNQTTPSTDPLPKPKKPQPTGVLKVRLYPTPYQKKKLLKMMSANRFAWNLLVEKLSGGKLFSLDNTTINNNYRKFVQKANLNKNLNIYKCPEECFDSAYRDILKAKTAIIAASVAKKKREGKGFRYPDRLKFRAKKADSGTSVEIRKRSLNYNPEARTISMFPTYFGKNLHNISIKTNLKKLGITEFDYSCRLTTDFDRFYLIIPRLKNYTSVTEYKICAIDPGVRTFLTTYDPNGEVSEYSTCNNHLHKKMHKIDKLKEKLRSIIAENKKKNKKAILKIQEEIRNLYRKIRNCVNDMHHKVSKKLADTHSEIILPVFNTRQMADNKNGKRVIKPSVARDMLTLSHYKFQQLLKHKMNQRSGKLHICTEEYTSKTCGNCGRLNHQLGSSKVFKCTFADCNIIIDRDVNAARNIYIKNYNMIGS